MDTYRYHYHDTNDTQLILFTNHQPWDLPRDRYHRTISRQAFEQPKNWAGEGEHKSSEKRSYNVNVIYNN